MKNRIEYIQELQNKVIKAKRRQSTVINNFYSIITIGVVCIAILFYTLYVVPAQKAKKQREDKIIKQQQYQLKRSKQIALSHKLNNKKNDTK